MILWWTDRRTDDRAKIISPNHNGGDLICLAQFPDAAYQALRSLALWVQRSFLKDFYHIQVCRPSSSCDVAHLSKLSFTIPWSLHMKFNFNWLQRRCRLKMLTDRRHTYTISYEPLAQVSYKASHKKHLSYYLFKEKKSEACNTYTVNCTLENKWSWLVNKGYGDMRLVKPLVITTNKLDLKFLHKI